MIIEIQRGLVACAGLLAHLLDWGGPVKTDSALRYAGQAVALELVWGAVAKGRVSAVEVEVGAEVVSDL